MENQETLLFYPSPPCRTGEVPSPGFMMAARSFLQPPFRTSPRTPTNSPGAPLLFSLNFLAGDCAALPQPFPYFTTSTTPSFSCLTGGSLPLDFFPAFVPKYTQRSTKLSRETRVSVLFFQHSPPQGDCSLVPLFCRFSHNLFPVSPPLLNTTVICPPVPRVRPGRLEPLFPLCL